MKRFTFLISVLLFGCAARERTAPAPLKPAAERAIAPLVTPIAGKAPAILGYSVQDRPITMHTFGAGDRPVLIMGAIHGDEPTSATVTTALVQLLGQYTQTPGSVPVVVIPIANPDGYAAGTRTNTHGVDLNRNFPAKNFSTTRSRGRRSFGGTTPLSEPESRVLSDTIDRLQPRLIISIHSMEKPCNNYDGPAQAVAELMSRYNRYPPAASIGYPTPGSLGSYAGIDKQIPMITLELPRRAPGEVAWRDNRDALLAAIAAMK